MKSLFLASALMLLTASAAAAQTGAILVSAEQVEQIRQSARAAHRCQCILYNGYRLRVLGYCRTHSGCGLLGRGPVTEGMQ